MSSNLMNNVSQETFIEGLKMSSEANGGKERTVSCTSTVDYTDSVLSINRRTPSTRV